MKEYVEYDYKDVQKRGSLERVEYDTLNASGEKIRKYANVYLPYEYYKTTEKYNVVYIMHGGGGNQDAFLDSCPFKNMLDYCFINAIAKPMIFVFPSYYNEEQPPRSDRGSDFEGNRTLFFQKELVNDLIPAVEGKYRTYADSVELAGLEKSRLHRAFGGFSMGGCTTWYAFTNNLKYISEFIPLSGDSWEVEVKGGESETVKTVDKLFDAVKNQGFTKSDFHIFAATGDKDIACPALTPMIEEMKTRTEIFDFSDEEGKGNLNYLLVPDKYHCYQTVYHYVYHYLPYLF